MTAQIEVTLGHGPLASRLSAAWNDRRAQIPDALAWLKTMRHQGLPHFALPLRSDDLPDIERLAARLAAGASDLVVFGIGGSSLGGQALAQIAGWGTPGYRPADGRPALHFVENLDGYSLDGLLARLDLGRTRVLAISKSGGTAETLAQTLIAVEAIERAAGAGALRDRFAMIVEPGSNPLRTLGQEIGCEIRDHDPSLGGRYSVLSLVGLTPAAAMGLAIADVRAGALETLNGLDEAEPDFALGAALSVAAADCSLGISVLWPYSDRLERLVMWWRQLWGESLGKGGKGSTPVRALGPVDQHSQLQLYLDGPNDKLFSIMTVRPGGGTPVSEAWAARIGQPILGGKTPAAIVAAQARATAQTLANRGRPVRTIRLDHTGERAIGALLMHFMLETLVAAHLLGVDPFDQPAVEEGKVLTRRFLSDGRA
jgi:glucose-6-phosphate isomerase